MNDFYRLVIIILICILISCSTKQESEVYANYLIPPVPFTDVTLTDNFWAKRIETNRMVTIPFGLNKCGSEGGERLSLHLENHQSSRA